MKHHDVLFTGLPMISCNKVHFVFVYSLWLILCCFLLAVTAIKFAHDDKYLLACSSTDGTLSVCALVPSPPSVSCTLRGHTAAIMGNTVPYICIVLLFVDTTSLIRVQITLKTSTNISRYVLQKTGLTSFLQTSHVAENASFSEKLKSRSQTVSIKNRVSREKSPKQQWNVGILKIVRTYNRYNLKIQQRRLNRPGLV